MFDLLIIGGGISGMVASIVTARRGKSVAILERNEKVGKKLLATGNGKCNMGNAATLEGNYNTNAIIPVMKKYNLEIQTSFWNSIGVLTKEIEGRIFPYSEQASSVLNALREEISRLNIKVVCSKEVSSISNGYEVDGYKAKNILLASGSSAGFGFDSGYLYEKFGHRNTALNGVLVPLLTDTENLKGLRGVRLKALVKLIGDNKEIASTFDEVIFKDNGVSGSAIFTLSTYIARTKAKKFNIILDLMPEYSESEIKEIITNLGGVDHLFHKEIVNNILRLSKSCNIVKVIKNYTLSNAKLGSKELAQVMNGGLELEDFNMLTLESKFAKGLFASGEVLNVDGACGGFNIMWAVASGMAVGENV